MTNGEKRTVRTQCLSFHITAQRKYSTYWKISAPLVRRRINWPADTNWKSHEEGWIYFTQISRNTLRAHTQYAVRNRCLTHAQSISHQIKYVLQSFICSTTVDFLSPRYSTVNSCMRFNQSRVFERLLLGPKTQENIRANECKTLLWKIASL